MKTESTLRSLIINKINSGLSEETARDWVALKYPEQEGEIWTLSLEKPKVVGVDDAVIRELSNMADVIQHDDPTEDLDVSMLEDDTIDVVDGVIEVTPVKEVIDQPVKRKYNTNKRKMRNLFLESDDKGIGHITATFMAEFKLNLTDAYNNALVVIADYDKKRFS